MIKYNNSELLKDTKSIIGDIVFKIFIEDESKNIILIGVALTEISTGIKKNIVLTIAPSAFNIYSSAKNKSELENFINSYKRRFNLGLPNKISLEQLETIDFGIIVPQIFS